MTAYSMVPPQGPPPGSPRARRDRQLKLTVPVSLFFVGGFWAIVLLSCAAGLTGATRFFYTPLAFVIGAFLFVRFPAAYLVHLWWIWFLTPFVRRVARSQRAMRGFLTPGARAVHARAGRLLAVAGVPLAPEAGGAGEGARGRLVLMTVAWGATASVLRCQCPDL